MAAHVTAQVGSVRWDRGAIETGRPGSLQAGFWRSKLLIPRRQLANEGQVPALPLVGDGEHNAYLLIQVD